MILYILQKKNIHTLEFDREIFVYKLNPDRMKNPYVITFVLDTGQELIDIRRKR